MKILIIGTTLFPLPPKGYSGLEMLVFNLSENLAKRGHQISVVCPEGSFFNEESIECIYTQINEDEEQSCQRYKGRMESGEFDVILDSSWQRWASMSNTGRSPQLPIVNWHHTHPSVYPTPIPVRYQMWVGLSKDHADNLGSHFGTSVKFIYNGIDTEVYKSNGKPKGEHYVWISRWTPEKGGMEVIEVAQRARVPIYMYGDTTFVANQSYVKACFDRTDGYFARAHGGISREAVVDAYSQGLGLVQWLNWQEPYGLFIPEAQACGCVPIVSRKGAAPELIKHGKTGYLVDSIEDMIELVKSDRVKEIDPEVMRKSVEKNFGLKPFTDRWEKLLTDVANGLRW